ncbi:phage baseplate assembly protein domain-containing protein [Neptuniibacter marinus]|uniref:phage baseplate assembly protein domain-containing protein n=1 Tax=Neptuniibacter marinus TaxID=1806670 RepID=UPI003B59A9AA
MSMVTELRRTMRKIRRINQRGLVRRASYANNTRFLQMQVEGGQPLDNLEHLEPFGFTSHPVAGAEGLVLAFNGNGSHSVVFCVGDRRYRMQVEEGEVAIYNRHGDKVHIKDNREIDVTAAVKANFNTPEVSCSGIVKAEDFITHDGVSVNNHDHTGDSGGTTSKANPS